MTAMLGVSNRSTVSTGDGRLYIRRPAKPWPSRVLPRYRTARLTCSALLGGTTNMKNPFSPGESKGGEQQSQMQMLGLKLPFTFPGFSQSGEELAVKEEPVVEPEPSTDLYVKLPAQAIDSEGRLAYPQALIHGFQAVKSIGIDGVAVSVAWGRVEGAGPQDYDFSVYRELAEMLASCGLKMQVTLKFCTMEGVGLPAWVVKEAEANSDLLFQDQYGNKLWDCLSIGVDEEQVVLGRSGAQIYSDLMTAFRDEFEDHIGTLITDVVIGMGPHGELRYPSYPQKHGMWHFPGIGEFQCYDGFLRRRLKQAAELARRPEWGESGPHNAGHYCSSPHETEFFADEGGWKSDRGRFFLEWYSSQLLQHGDLMLGLARKVFHEDVSLGMKLPVVHWWYRTKSHAAELTAGVYRTEDANGYYDLTRLAAKYGAFLQCSCAEMRDVEQSEYAMCSPEELIKDIRKAASEHGIRVAVENCTVRFDDAAFSQMELNTVSSVESAHSMSFVSMDDDMFKAYHWAPFSSFVKGLNASISASREEAEALGKEQRAAEVAADAKASGSGDEKRPWFKFF